MHSRRLIDRFGQMVQRLTIHLDKRLSIDVQSLRLFRCALGLTLALQFAGYLTEAQALLSDEGVLPIESWKKLPHANWPWVSSLLALSGSTLWSECCLMLGILLALLLAIGYRVRWISLSLLVLLHSVQARNPWVLYAADKLLFLLLLWYSLLVASLGRQGASGSVIRHLAGWGLRLQVCVMYLFSVLRKTGHTWEEGTAVRYVLEIDQFSRPEASWLLDLPPNYLQIMTWSTLTLECLAPFMLLSISIRWRCLGLFSLCMLQLGFWFTMDLGWFPWISTLALIPHLPARLTGKPDRASFLEPFRFSHWDRLAGWLLVGMLGWNLAMNHTYPDTLKSRLPAWIGQSIALLRLDQYWGMFAPNPMVHDGWFVMLATYPGGQQLDLLDPERQDPALKPANVLATFPSDRWKDFLMMLYDYPDQAHLWEGVVQWFVSAHQTPEFQGQQPESIRVLYMMEETLEEGVAPPVEEQLWPRPASMTE